MLIQLMDELRVKRPGTAAVRNRPSALLGDKAYSSRANRAYLRRRRYEAAIPEHRDQQNHRTRRGSTGGRSPKVNAEKYRDRKVIECGYGRLKQWRSLATCYDKLAVVYRAVVVLYAAIAWLNHLSEKYT